MKYKITVESPYSQGKRVYETSDIMSTTLSKDYILILHGHSQRFVDMNHIVSLEII